MKTLANIDVTATVTPDVHALKIRKKRAINCQCGGGTLLGEPKYTCITMGVTNLRSTKMSYRAMHVTHAVLYTTVGRSDANERPSNGYVSHNPASSPSYSIV